MLESDLERDACTICMDAKGELTAAVRELHIEGLRIIDPRNPVAINPLDVGEDAIDQLLFLFTAIAENAKVTPKQEAFLRPLLRAMVTGFPDPTLATLQTVINDKRPFQSHIQQLPPDLRNFFDVEWGDYDATRSELTWRLRLLLDNRLIRALFSAPKTRFKMPLEMNRRGPIVIDNSIALVGKLGSAFMGKYFLSAIWEGAMARFLHPRREKKLVFVYLDEADTVIDHTIADIIDKCRAARICLILAIQRKGQIKDPNVLSALEDCAIKMVNVGAEASYFSKLLHIPEERLCPQPLGHLPRGQFAIHVRGKGSEIVTVPRAKLPFRNMTEAETKAHQQRMIDLYGYETPVKVTTQTAPERAVSVSPSREGKAGAKISSAGISPEVDRPIVSDDLPAPAVWKRD
ncbi:hypothetical protein IVB45_02300 [Bradyrhizobium sp. 4]|nr:type IV secretory system conjugative DNA transfer family protein [Bradyrhizobium sp. 4]UPJ35866.1 hypothetical protein IVB45_02300 [Bradyrhizobium sp. 4]